MKHEKEISQLSNLLRNESSESEQKQIQNRLETEPEFAQTFQMLKDIESSTRLNALESKMQMLKDLELNKSTKHIASKSSQSKIRKLPLVRYAVAAMLAIILGSVVYNWTGDNELQKFDNFDEFVIHETMRGGNSNSQNAEQQKNFNLFILKKYDEAIPGLKKLWESEDDELAGYYLGISYWMTGKKKEAKDILESDRFEKYKKPY